MIDFERKEHYGLSDLLRIVALLRSEDGCPWDRVQTHASLRRSLLEEAYEAAEAIDREDPALLKEELGDLLLQVVFHADIERQAGDFTMDDVADGEVRKMLFRHPHVFGGQETGQDADTVLEGWEAIKRREKGPYPFPFQLSEQSRKAHSRLQSIFSSSCAPCPEPYHP